MSIFAPSAAGPINRFLAACARIVCCVAVVAAVFVILIRRPTDLGVKAASHPAKASKKHAQFRHSIELRGGIVTWPANGDPSTVDISASGSELSPQALANFALSRFVGMREDEALPDADSAHVNVFVNGRLAATGTMADPGDHFTATDLFNEITKH